MAKAEPVIKKEDISCSNEDESSSSQEDDVSNQVVVISSSDEDMGDAPIKQECVKYESSSSQEDDISTQVVVISSSDEDNGDAPIKQQHSDIFYNNGTIRAFTSYLQKNGVPRKEALQCGAEAYHVWRNIDTEKTIEGFLNSTLISKWIETKIHTNKALSMVIGYLNSTVKLVQFMIKRDFVLKVNIIRAKETISTIGMSIKYLKQENKAVIEETTETQVISESENKEFFISGSTNTPDDDPLSEPELFVDNEEFYIAERTKTPSDKTLSESELSEDEEIDDSSTEMTVAFDRARIWDNPLAKEFFKWNVGVPFLSAEKTAYQHMQQAFIMWHYVSSNYLIDELLERTALNGWFTKNLDIMAPGSLSSYLGSYTRLLEFLQDISKFRDGCAERLTRMLLHIKHLRRSISKKKKQRQAMVETEDIQNMIKPADIVKFLHCDVVKHCEIIANQPAVDVHPKDFYDVRDLLLFRLIETNAQRPMAIRSINEKIVNKATLNEEGWATLMVPTHKTTTTQGAATIAVSPEIYSMLKNFIQMSKRIPHFTPDADRSVFTTWPKSGADNQIIPLNSSQVNMAINRLWAQGPVKKSISATKLRKATTTHVRQENPGSRETLARHMAHDPRTADKHYQVYNSHQMAVPMSKLITNIMENRQDQLQKTIHWPKNKEQTQDEQEEGVLKPLEKTDESKVIDEKEEEDDSGNSEMTIDYDFFPEVPPQSPLNVQELCDDPEGEEEQHLISKHKRRFFDRHESMKIIELCEDNINEGHLTLSAIKTSLGRSEEGKILFERLVEKNKEELTEKDVLKKIVDRLRTKARKVKKN